MKKEKEGQDLTRTYFVQRSDDSSDRSALLTKQHAIECAREWAADEGKKFYICRVVAVVTPIPAPPPVTINWIAETEKPA